MTPGELTAVEMMTCMAARLVEDNRAYCIGFGRPQIAAVLAQQRWPLNRSWLPQWKRWPLPPPTS